MNVIKSLICYLFLIQIMTACTGTVLAQVKPDGPILKPDEPEKSLAVIEDGDAIIKPGVFEPGCFYDESLSDHAPVIYGELGTWNIGSPLSHYLIKPAEDPTKAFFNHKFHTDSQGNLVDRAGKKVGYLGGSEVKLGVQGQKGLGLISDLYVDRMRKVAKAIKELFKNRADLKLVVLQETPGAWQKTMSGKDLRTLIREAFMPLPGEEELSVTFFTPDPVGAPAREEMKAPELPALAKRQVAIDVGMVEKKAMALKQEIADHYNRMVPFCNVPEKICYLSTHMPFTTTNEELKGRCKAIHDQVLRLFKNGYTHVKIAGDFNTNAHRMADVCKDTLTFPNASVTLHTSKGGKGSSCSTNSGEVTTYNIDLMIEFKFH